jgi:hypothetical protein
MQCACAILSPVACLTQQYFFHIISKNGAIFRKIKITEHDKCFDFLYNFYPNHFSFQEKFGEILSQRNTNLYVK